MGATYLRVIPRACIMLRHGLRHRIPKFWVLEISSFLYILFLLLIIKNTVNVESEIGKFTALAVVFLGLIFGFLDGNWMTSFGDPVDRISMVTIALVLSTTNFSKSIKQPQSSLSIIPAQT